MRLGRSKLFESLPWSCRPAVSEPAPSDLPCNLEFGPLLPRDQSFTARPYTLSHQRLAAGPGQAREVRRLLPHVLLAERSGRLLCLRMLRFSDARARCITTRSLYVIGCVWFDC